MVQSLYQGLVAPRGCLKVDTSSLESFLEKLLNAVISTDAELAKLRDENAALKKDVAVLQGSDSKTLKSEIADLGKRVRELETKLVSCEKSVQQKADANSVQEIKIQAELASRIATDVRENFSSYSADTSKQIKEIRSQLTSLSNQISDQISKLSESKANKSDLIQITSKAESALQQADKNTVDIRECLRSNAEFMERAEAELAKKVGYEAINDKMGRMECDDLLKKLGNEFHERMRRANKSMQEMRDDIDVLLTMMMQDAKMGAGTTVGLVHCISCQKPVAVHRPGPPPGSGRDPVIVQGRDRQMYRGAREGEGGEYTPMWASSQLPSRASASADPSPTPDPHTPSRRASATDVDRTPPASSARPVRPASAKVRKVPPI